MSDTSPGACTELTPTQRVRMMREMFATDRRLLVTGIRAEQPEISDTELPVESFRRTYRGDYTPEERDRIVAALRQSLTSPVRQARHRWGGSIYP